MRIVMSCPRVNSVSKGVGVRVCLWGEVALLGEYCWPPPVLLGEKSSGLGISGGGGGGKVRVNFFIVLYYLN